MECRRFSVHRARLFIRAVKQAQMFLFGTNEALFWSSVVAQSAQRRLQLPLKNPQEASGKLNMSTVKVLCLSYL